MKIKYLIAAMMILPTASIADASCVGKYIVHMDEHTVIEGGKVAGCGGKMWAGAKATCQRLIGKSDPFEITLAVFTDAAASCGDKPATSASFTDADKAANAGDVSCKKLDFSAAIAHVKGNKSAQDWCSTGATELGGKVSMKFAINCGCDGKPAEATTTPFKVKIIGGE